jgi:hypothetical protein
MNLKHWGLFEMCLSRIQLEKKATPFSGFSQVVSGELRMESPDIKLVSGMRVVPLIISVKEFLFPHHNVGFICFNPAKG